ncbi:MAG: hypothetical protein IJF78_16760 [Clostridia bacterium]|nr:hypothetical protein [Clostridia bacterium]
MRSVYDNWKTAETEADGFAGANTPGGFRSSYDTIADEGKLERVYIIKGGSGTGKSTLMHRIASAAEKQGKCCARYLCGSDPDSLDCVVIGGRIAVLDGTAPHVREMKLPGASSAIIDVSRFWDPAKLEPYREELAQRAAVKAAAYASCTRWLAAADEAHRERLALAERIFNRRKAEAFAGRFLDRLGKTQPGERLELWSHAVTMKGRWRTGGRPAAHTFAVRDYYGLAPVFLDLLDGMMTERRIGHTAFRLPLTGTAASLYLEPQGIAVTASEEEGTQINMKRFVLEIPEGIRGRIRLAGEITESCLNAAADALKDAAEHHFAVESVYRPAMDFKALNRYGDTVIREILARL